MNYTIAVVGADSNIGRTVLKVLNARGVPASAVAPLSSKELSGKSLSYGEEQEVKCVDLDGYEFSNASIAIFTTSSVISERYAVKAVKSGCIAVDGSYFFHTKEDIPLVIPEVNRDDIALYKNRGIVSVPCSTASQILVALNPLHRLFKIKRIVASTYQSVSEIGNEGMSELYNQTKSMFMNKKIKPTEFEKQIAFNCIPCVGDLMENGASEEENRICTEVERIMKCGALVSITCVRVPVFVSNSQAISVEFYERVTREDAVSILEEHPEIFIIDHESDMRYTTPIDCVDDEEVYVSRIREDKTVPNGLSLWITSDNIKRSALNLVQTALILGEEYL